MYTTNSQSYYDAISQYVQKPSIPNFENLQRYSEGAKADELAQIHGFLGVAQSTLNILKDCHAIRDKYAVKIAQQIEKLDFIVQNVKFLASARLKLEKQENSQQTTTAAPTDQNILGTQQSMQAPKSDSTLKTYCDQLNLCRPWNTSGTVLLLEFNRKFTTQGQMMEGANDCAHPVIEYLLFIFDHINTNHFNQPLSRGFEDLISQAAFFLALLGRNEKAREKIIQHNGVPILLSLISKLSTEHDSEAAQSTQDLERIDLFDQSLHGLPNSLPNPSSQQTLVNLCFALGQILTNFTADEHSVMQFKCLIPLLFENLKKNLDDSQLVQYVHFAIGNMAFLCDLEPQMLASEGIECALEGLITHGQSVHVVTDIFFFLTNLAYGAEGRKRIIDKGGLEKVLLALIQNRNFTDAVDVGMNLIYDLTFLKSTIEKLSSLNYIRFFQSLAMQHGGCFATTQQIINVLARVYLQSDDFNRGLLIKEGFFNCLIYLYRLHHQDPARKGVMDSIFARLGQEASPVCIWTDMEMILPIQNIAALRLAQESKESKGQLSMLNATQILPSANQGTLALQARRCDKCATNFLHGIGTIHSALFPPTRTSVPLYWQLCSEQCSSDLLSTNPVVMAQAQLTPSAVTTPATMLPDSNL